jgi:hypothetical protein
MRVLPEHIMGIISDFEFKGVLIADPFFDESSTVDVNPQEYYKSVFKGKTLWLATRKGNRPDGAITSCGQVHDLMSRASTEEVLYLIIKTSNELPYYSNS